MKCEIHHTEMDDCGAADGIHVWFCELCDAEESGIEICPACGEADCQQTCMAYVLVDGDECPTCGSHYTQRVDTIHDEADFTVWTEQCGACGETFEFLIQHPVNDSA